MLLMLYTGVKILLVCQKGGKIATTIKEKNTLKSNFFSNYFYLLIYLFVYFTNTSILQLQFNIYQVEIGHFARHYIEPGHMKW